MDRAQRVYESMTMRGFRGEFFLRGSFIPLRQSVLYGVVWCLVLAVFRLVPVFELVGRIFIR